MEAAFTLHAAPCWIVARIAILVLVFPNFVSGERPSEVYTRGPRETQRRNENVVVDTEPKENLEEVAAIDTPAPDALDGDAANDEETVKEATRHGMGPMKANQASAAQRQKRRRDSLDGMYFHDSEKASQLVEREARNIDREATKAEGKAKNVTAEITKYDKKLKDLLKSLRRLAKKQQAYATQVNAEYMDKEYGPSGRLQAFTDFDLQKVTPFGDQEKPAKVSDGTVDEADGTLDDDADTNAQRTVDKNLQNAETTAKLAQQLAKDLTARVNDEKKHNMEKKKNRETKRTNKKKKHATKPEPEVAVTAEA